MSYRIKIGRASIKTRPDGRTVIEKPVRARSVSDHIKARKSKRVRVARPGTIRPK